MRISTKLHYRDVRLFSQFVTSKCSWRLLGLTLLLLFFFFACDWWLFPFIYVISPLTSGNDQVLTYYFYILSRKMLKLCCDPRVCHWGDNLCGDECVITSMWCHVWCKGDGWVTVVHADQREHTFLDGRLVKLLNWLIWKLVVDGGNCSVVFQLRLVFLKVTARPSGPLSMPCQKCYFCQAGWWCNLSQVHFCQYYFSSVSCPPFLSFPITYLFTFHSTTQCRRRHHHHCHYHYHYHYHYP